MKKDEVNSTSYTTTILWLEMIVMPGKELRFIIFYSYMIARRKCFGCSLSIIHMSRFLQLVDYKNKYCMQDRIDIDNEAERNFATIEMR